MSAKKPRKVKERQKEEGRARREGAGGVKDVGDEDGRASSEGEGERVGGWAPR